MQLDQAQLHRHLTIRVFDYFAPHYKKSFNSFVPQYKEKKAEHFLDKHIAFCTVLSLHTYFI